MIRGKWQKPDLESTLGGLKDFQRSTVDYVYHRLYEAGDRVDRFLVADETGLGKTYVARGIIARIVDRLWDEAIESIDIVYICSNSAIAAQNVRKLVSAEFAGIVGSSRITLLPPELSRLHEAGHRVNVIAFTPRTSFDMGNSSGVVRERAIIYNILRRHWGLGDREGPLRLLRCNVGQKRWLETIEAEKAQPLDKVIVQDFVRRCEPYRDEFTALTRQAARVDRTGYEPAGFRRAQLAMVGRLRLDLARACMSGMRPASVIMDEFHRFRDLLDDESEAGNLFRALVETDTRVLLLSATPYKMYTVGNEEGDDHYRDFVQTVGFLLDDDVLEGRFTQSLARLRLELQRARANDGAELESARAAVEGQLRRVMVRTERLAATADRSGMLQELPEECMPTPSDLEHFRMVDAVCRELGARDAVEYWKSSPYILNLMDSNYDVKNRLEKAIDSRADSAQINEALEDAIHDGLQWKAVQHYREIPFPNARMRALRKNTVETGLWRLLWMPPSMPYYDSGHRAYRGLPSEGVSKALVFSKWQVVPKAISLLLSYEAERLGMKSAGGRRRLYDSKRRGAATLAFGRDDTGGPANMANMALIYPCWTLATRIDPALLAAELTASSGALPSQKAIVAEAGRLVRRLLAQIQVSADTVNQAGGRDSQRGPSGTAWVWISLAALDAHLSPTCASRWLHTSEAEAAPAWRGMVQARQGDADDTGFALHVDQFTAEFDRQLQSRDTDDSRPLLHAMGGAADHVVNTLAMAALSSPAVVALRAFLRLQNTRRTDACSDDMAMALAARIALCFRDMFNLAESSVLVRPRRKTRTEPYWSAVLSYCLGGNLQAVMDEYLHVLNEPDRKLSDICEEVVNAISIRSGALSFDEIVRAPEASPSGVALRQRKMRCRFAMRFGESAADDVTYGSSDVIRPTQVMSAFNSPFRPFVLATTSIGQEGLDMHRYCHDVYHWNLPTNPVDLEQREGRVHRYKCYAIRRNLAAIYGGEVLSGSRDPIAATADRVCDPVFDPWSLMFGMALDERSGQENDLKPYWILDMPDGVKINRRILAPALSWETQAVTPLKNSLALYRMVFGQPRQQDLLGLLQDRMKGGDIPTELAEFMIDLSPPNGKPRQG